MTFFCEHPEILPFVEPASILLSNIYVNNFQTSGSTLISDFGRSIVNNSDNTIIYVGAPKYNGIGAVLKYKLINNQYILNKTISPPCKLELKNYGDVDFGSAMATDEIGNFLMIGGKFDDNDKGSVWIYENTDDDTDPVVIRGKNQNGFFGNSVACDFNGSIIAIGEPGINSVYIYKYDYDQKSWINIFRLENDTKNEYNFGFDISMNHDGNKIAISCIENQYFLNLQYTKGIHYYKNYPNIYIIKFDCKNKTHSIEFCLNETMKSKLKKIGFGNSIALSGNGKTLIVGAPFYQTSYINDLYGTAPSSQIKLFRFDNNKRGINKCGKGRIFIFEYIDDHWVLSYENTPKNSSICALVGSSVSINHDGSIVCAGGPFDSGSNFFTLLDQSPNSLDSIHFDEILDGNIPYKNVLRLPKNGSIWVYVKCDNKCIWEQHSSKYGSKNVGLIQSTDLIFTGLFPQLGTSVKLNKTGDQIIAGAPGCTFSPDDVIGGQIGIGGLFIYK